MPFESRSQAIVIYPDPKIFSYMITIDALHSTSLLPKTQHSDKVGFKLDCLIQWELPRYGSLFQH